MGFLIGLLTVVMVLDCLVLILLVLIQLPKKDAGAGLAFGGGATDALFGAGSGNVLTKITKYAATTFFVMSVVLSLMQRNYHTRTTSAFEKGLQSANAPVTAPGAPAQAPSVPPVSPKTVATNAATVAGTNAPRVAPGGVEDTNVPISIPLTPAPTAPPKK
jgi:preprotein translocase subunit SecG